MGRGKEVANFDRFYFKVQRSLLFKKGFKVVFQAMNNKTVEFLIIDRDEQTNESSVYESTTLLRNQMKKNPQ